VTIRHVWVDKKSTQPSGYVDLHIAGASSSPPPSAGRLHLFGVDICFDDVCGLEDIDAVVAIRFKFCDARSTFKVVGRTARVSLTASVEHILWCLLVDVKADVLCGSVCKCCSVHAYILQHFVYHVK
jgi:hypothetical protein